MGRRAATAKYENIFLSISQPFCPDFTYRHFNSIVHMIHSFPPGWRKALYAFLCTFAWSVHPDFISAWRTISCISAKTFSDYSYAWQHFQRWAGISESNFYAQIKEGIIGYERHIQPFLFQGLAADYKASSILQNDTAMRFLFEALGIDLNSGCRTKFRKAIKLDFRSPTLGGP